MPPVPSSPTIWYLFDIETQDAFIRDKCLALWWSLSSRTSRFHVFFSFFRTTNCFLFLFHSQFKCLDNLVLSYMLRLKPCYEHHSLDLGLLFSLVWIYMITVLKASKKISDYLRNIYFTWKDFQEKSFAMHAYKCFKMIKSSASKEVWVIECEGRIRFLWWASRGFILKLRCVFYGDMEYWPVFLSKGSI